MIWKESSFIFLFVHSSKLQIRQYLAPEGEKKVTRRKVLQELMKLYYTVYAFILYLFFHETRNDFENSQGNSQEHELSQPPENPTLPNESLRMQIDMDSAFPPSKLFNE